MVKLPLDVLLPLGGFCRYGMGLDEYDSTKLDHKLLKPHKI